MIKRKHIIFLFQVILLLFVVRITYTTINFSLDKEKTSLNLFDYPSQDNTEEESNDKEEKEEIIADEEFVFFNINQFLFTNTFDIPITNDLFVSKNALQSIFIPPPELV